MIRLYLLVAILGSVSASLEVEHSFDGSTFFPAGKLVGNPQLGSELSWERPELTVDEAELLEKAIETDGLYSIRLRTGKNALLTSVPVACLRITGSTEKAELLTTREGVLVALSYDISGCGVKGPAQAVGEDSGSTAVAERPARLAVQVQLPKVGPMLTQPEAVGEFMDIPVDSGDLGAAAYDPNAKPRAAAAPAGGQGARKGGPPPPDDRTWLQKNWLFVVAGGMMVLNVIAKANAPPQGPGGPGGPGGAPAGGAAGPRRG